MGKIIFCFLFGFVLNTSAQALELKCTDQFNCHPALAAVEINYPQTGPLDHCTGVLIGQDKVLTNGHCVIGRVGYNGNTKQGQSCLGISVHFAKTEDFPAQTVTCRKLAQLTPYPVHEGINVPDYVILQIDKVERPFLKLAEKEEINDKEKFQLLKVDFSKNQNNEYTATQSTSENCETDFSINILYQPGNKTPVFFTKNCKIKPGNSGSVLLNKNKEIVGLIFRATPLGGKKVTEGTKEGFYPFGGVAMNTSCLPTHLGEEKNVDWERACDGVNYIKQSILYTKKLGDEITKLAFSQPDISFYLQKAKQEHQSYLNFSFQKRDGVGVESTVFTTVLSAQVDCIKDVSKLRSAMIFPQYYMVGFLDKDYKWQVANLGKHRSIWTFQGATKNLQGKIEYIYQVKQVATELKIKKAIVQIPACEI